MHQAPVLSAPGLRGEKEGASRHQQPWETSCISPFLTGKSCKNKNKKKKSRIWVWFILVGTEPSWSLERVLWWSSAKESIPSTDLVGISLHGNRFISLKTWGVLLGRLTKTSAQGTEAVPCDESNQVPQTDNLSSKYQTLWFLWHTDKCPSSCLWLYLQGTEVRWEQLGLSSRLGKLQEKFQLGSYREKPSCCNTHAQDGAHFGAWLRLSKTHPKHMDGSYPS